MLPSFQDRQVARLCGMWWSLFPAAPLTPLVPESGHVIEIDYCAEDDVTAVGHLKVA